MENRLFAFGFGYTAQMLARELPADEWQIAGTSRGQHPDDRIVVWPGSDISDQLHSATHILSSIAPTSDDIVLEILRKNVKNLPNLKWLGLLSTTGVYGGTDGGWVTEDSPHVPNGHRGATRARQYDDWMELFETAALPVHVFHLAGIYGPGRSAFDKLRDGSARRIVKKDQVFSRIHVKDIAQVLRASFEQPNPGAAYNLADDMPAPPQDVIEVAANMLGVPVSPDIPFETADLSPMARSFYADNKRISNARIKAELGVKLLFPDFHSGLRAIFADGH